MKEKSGDRQSWGGKLLEGLEQAGDRSDSCSEIILGNCMENGGHTSSVCPGAQPGVLPGMISNHYSLAREAPVE